MKKIVALAALATTVATGAFAMVGSSTDLAEIQRYAPAADVHSLSNTEVGTLLNVIHGSDSEGEKGQFVRSFFLNN